MGNDQTAVAADQVVPSNLYKQALARRISRISKIYLVVDSHFELRWEIRVNFLSMLCRIFPFLFVFKLCT